MCTLQRDSEYLREPRFGNAGHIRGFEPRRIYVRYIRREDVMSLKVIVESLPQRIDVLKRTSHAHSKSTAYARPAFPEINQHWTLAGFRVTPPGASSTHPSDRLPVR